MTYSLFKREATTSWQFVDDAHTQEEFTDIIFELETQGYVCKVVEEIHPTVYETKPKIEYNFYARYRIYNKEAQMILIGAVACRMTKTIEAIVHLQEQLLNSFKEGLILESENQEEVKTAKAIIEEINQNLVQVEIISWLQLD